MKKYKFSIDYKSALFSIVISTIFVFIASYSTSPLYPNYYGHDSAQFQLLGKCWLQGIIPLIDIFDHKGPLIFFINAVGYYITCDSLGVFFIQIFFLAFTIYILFLISSYYLSTSSSFVFFPVLIALVFLSASYNDGNLTEEYCLPFICLSIYFQLKYLNNEPVQHPLFYSLIYGISFAICLCTRVTNAIIICSGIIIICVLLIKFKYYNNLVLNLFVFISGISVVCIPFAIYYYIHGGLYEVFYCAILANIEYKKFIVPWFTNARPFNYFVYCDVFFPSYCLLFSSIFLCLRKKYALAWFCVLTSILESYLFLSGNLFRHYAIIAIPQFILFFCELVFYVKNNHHCFVISVLKNCCIAFTLVFSTYNAIDFVYKSYEIYNERDNNFEYDVLLRIANKHEPFIVYGGDSLVHFYIRNNIIPCYKYYILQEWQSKTMPKIAKQIKSIYSSCKAKWILSDNNYKNIEEILDKHYTMVARTDKYKLWRLKT